MGVYDELKARGMIAQTTHEEEVKDLLNNKKCTFYIGFDPTADSLHVGHFVTVMTMSHLQRAGHTPIALFGGGTGKIGDPSGKTDMRKMMTEETIDYNVSCFVKQMSRFIDFGEGKAIMANNKDWLDNLNYIDFLREIGVHFSVNKMLAAECYKQRLERGLSFFELNYMIMQSYDFLMLNRKYGCTLQLGGNDQWSNIISGVELCRRIDQKDVYGLTLSLLLTPDGRKMGKTEKGAVWLDPDKTSPYDFYQYWRNVDDASVINSMNMLTFVPLEEIAEYAKLEGSDINRAKERLAYEVTKQVHGEDEAKKAEAAAKSAFFGSQDSDDIPSTVLEAEALSDGVVNILDLLVKAGLAPSKSEARRLVTQGGISADGEKITDINFSFDEDSLKKGVMIKKGKKVYHKVSM